MKKIIIGLLVVMVALQYSCKKFLNITPINMLTGNNYYQSASDVETNLNDMYGALFDKYNQTNTAGGTGEFRSGEVIPSSNTVGTRRLRYDAGLLGGHTRTVAFSGTTQGFQTIPNTIVNDRLLLTALQPSYNGTTNLYQFANLTHWDEYYKIIQQANILVSKLNEGIPGVSGDLQKSYLEEAKFIRCYCYFFMVRLYGDVAYYTTAYQKDPLPRMNMVTVVNNCIADLAPGKADMSWAVSNPALRGVRASRGAVTGLLMAMNMWNAGFDPANKTKYYTATESLGLELDASKAFVLLPLTEWNSVTKGRSAESLFELFATVSYAGSAQVFQYAQFGESFIHFPYRLPEYDNRTSPCVFTAAYMNKLYPDNTDGRLTFWFDDPFNQNAETFQMKKFAGNTYIDSSKPLNTAIPDATFLIMRYADALLYEAEAAAQLGHHDVALTALNAVRIRATAASYPSQTDVDTPAGLLDAIFWERAKELMGEGDRYFDLVRTKRIMNKLYTDNPLTLDKFSRGGWTWPIDAGALSKNPYMTLNTYWVGTGIQ